MKEQYAVLKVFLSWQWCLKSVSLMLPSVDITAPGYFSSDLSLDTSLTQGESAYKTGLAYLQATYPRFTWTLEFLSSKEIYNCPTLQDNVQFLLSRWYYTRPTNSGQPIIITPGCFETAYLNALAASWNVLLITGLDFQLDMQDRTVYPTYLTTSPITPPLAVLYCAFFRAMNWTKLYMLYDRNSSPYYFVHSTRDIGDMKVICPAVQVTRNEFSSADKNTLVMASKLLEFNGKSRVMLYLGGSFGLRKILEVASELQMTEGEHVFFAVRPYDSDNFGRTPTWQPSDQDSEEIRHAYRSSMIMVLVDESAFQPEAIRRLIEQWTVMRGEQQKQFAVPFPKNMSSPQSLPIETALEMVGYAINRTYSLEVPGHVPYGTELASALLNQTIDLRIGRIHVMSNGQVSHHHHVYSFDDLTNSYEVFMRSSVDLRTETYRFMREGNGRWFGRDDFPPDEPKCGFDGTRDDCQSSSSNLFRLESTLGFAAVLGSTGVLAWRIKRNRRFMQLWWLLPTTMLQFKPVVHTVFLP